MRGEPLAARARAAEIECHPLRSALLPGTLFVSNIAVGFLGLRLVNVPMFLAVRRTTTIFTMAAEWAILGNQPSGLAM